MSERDIFISALRIEGADERSDFIQEACGNDQAMRQRVEVLLDFHQRANTFLETPPAALLATAAPTVDMPPIAERPGTQIGHYKLLQEIGEGGMGVVYMAHQREPVRRRVALKIIKPGMDTREVIARFQAEEQALAMMDHPNIAKVHDAGTTESGRPYFVMELVNGVPISEYCDDNNLTTRERLQLFVLVCNAVQHAHQKGIIHRDIKPSNILVTLHDGVPVPKIIDFGIAKAVNQELTANTLYTGFGQIVGTPLYMSPEQAERSGLDVDTRSDIYSLGVLLYELLTGTTPFDKKQLKEAGLDELRRLIREEEPPRPSTRVSTLGKAATTVSIHRKTNPAGLSHTLRQEVDWIVMKAMDKDRTRRYETAADFARDIQRYLSNDAVEACPPTTVYRLRKFTRRNRAAVLTTAAIGLALILGAGVAAGQAYRATKAERVAEEQLQIAKEQRRLANRQAQLAKEAEQRERQLRGEAEAARKQAEAVTDYLVEIFRSPDPARDGRTITVAESLGSARKQLAAEFQDDPLLTAKLRAALGRTYLALGLTAESVELLENAVPNQRDLLGAKHPETLHATANLARSYMVLRRFDEAIALLKEALQSSRESLGPQHPVTLKVLSGLGETYFHAKRSDQAVLVLEELIELQAKALGRTHEDALATMRDLAAAQGEAGNRDEAIRLGKEALELCGKALGKEHPATLEAMNQLAVTYAGAEDREEAIKLLEEVIPLMRQQFGEEHYNTLTSMHNLGVCYSQVGRYEDGITVLEETTRLWQKVPGTSPHKRLLLMAWLIVSYREAGQDEEAFTLATDARQLARKTLGDEHPTTLSMMGRLISACNEVGKHEQAITLGRDALPATRKTLGDEDPTTLSMMRCLIRAFIGVGQYDKAVALGKEALSLTRNAVGNEHDLTPTTMCLLATALYASGNLVDAITLQEEAVALNVKVNGAEHPQTLESISTLGGMYAEQGKYRESERLLEEAYHGFAKRDTASPTSYDRTQSRKALIELIQLYETWNQPEKAASWKEKLNALKE